MQWEGCLADIGLITAGRIKGVSSPSPPILIYIANMGASETSTSMKAVEQEPKFPHLQRHSSIKLSIEDKILAVINPVPRLSPFQHTNSHRETEATHNPTST
jgi:hypothetical protein